MKNLFLKAFGGLIFLLIVMAMFLFIPAGTLSFWRGWVFLAVFIGASLIITVYLIRHDPGLLARRVQAGPTAEKLTTEKIIQSVNLLWFIAMLVIPGLDYRYGWSLMPPIISVAGNALMLVGFLIVFLVFKVNSFTSATVEISAGQKVITTGPYRLVRHPMYLGAFILLTGMALALGSWWNFALFFIAAPALIWRMYDEENHLANNLPGYKAYQEKVKHHLIPWVW